MYISDKIIHVKFSSLIIGVLLELKTVNSIYIYAQLKATLLLAVQSIVSNVGASF